MARYTHKILLATCWLLATTQYVSAQSTFPFQLRAQQGTSAATVPNGSVITIATGGVGQSVSLNILITYQGSTEGVLSSPNLYGAGGFELVESAAFPLSLKPGQATSLTYRYTATTGNAVQAQLSITYYEVPTSGTAATSGAIALGFLGTAPEFVLAYYMQVDGNLMSVSDGGKIGFPATSVNSSSLATVVVLNRGSGPGTLTSASVAGVAFQVLNLPLLPGTLTAGGQVSFNIRYSPKQTETSIGSLQLKIGEQTLTAILEGTAIAPVFAYEMIRADGTDVIQPNQVITVPDTAVGEITSVQLRVRNDGNADGTVNVISVSGQGFSLSYVPFLPAVLAPNTSFVFTLRFEPTKLGSAPGRLLIGTSTFELICNGLGPPPLPTYRFVGASGSQEPLQQVGIGLTLDSPYALPLTGTLTMSVSSDVFGTDPSVQFSTGGRTAPFTIPANSTQAVFNSGSTTIKLQTGSVAGIINVTPSFAVRTGYSVTPDAPAGLSLSVAPSAPRLLSVQVGARSASGFTLLITGYATTRALKQMDLQFTLAPNANVNLTNARVTISLDPTFDLWYKSAESQLYGSLFTATLPFNLLLGSSGITNPVDLIQSVAVTVKNDQGISNSLSVGVRQ
ncbi:MAG: choice-of-anchor D domain-containing protein [Acidobacteriales bacterium]|nr:choice-of-anchor D domain-containing protein [Terriglobales bacterium]